MALEHPFGERWIDMIADFGFNAFEFWNRLIHDHQRIERLPDG